MSSGKNKTESGSRRTNGDDLRRALDWIIVDGVFANVGLHGNTKWTVAGLVRVAVFWMWSPESNLVAAADEAIGCAGRIFGKLAINSYQTLMNGLQRYSSRIIPLLMFRMHVLMEIVDDGRFRNGKWVPIGIDGSRVSVPRTARNEQRFCKPKKKKGKRKKKSRGRHAKSKARTHKKKHYDPQPVSPQMWLTLMWHMGQRLPWCWKTGPSYSSERHHATEMIQQQAFPEYTLFCGDAGFVGYDFWRAIGDAGHHFLVRVGGNVRLLKKLGYVRERDGIVYCWPDAAMKKKQAPLVLRLLQLKDARNNNVYLVTNVLDKSSLSDRQAGDLYRQRWGIEVQFRSLKQTFGRTKLRAGTPEAAKVELEWSLVALWMLQLLALKEQTKTCEPDEKTSIAHVLRIVRHMMRHDSEVPDRGDSFQKQLGRATTDNYERKSTKKSRNYPRRKEEPAPGKPKLKNASKEQKKRLEQIETMVNAP